MTDRPTLVLALVAVLLSGIALWRTFLPPESAESFDEREEHEEEAHGELAPHMAALQRYAEKLYHAGTAEHWTLAAFYGHELEETAEAIEDGGFVEDGQALAPLMARWLVPTVEAAEAAAEAGDRATFDAAYGELVAACNTCHAATDHGFVQITVPRGNAYPSQDFAP